MPSVSVVIPVYNCESYVADAVESVLAQTFTDFELIIIDDGSPDHSVEICKSYTDPRIRIVSQANRGLAGARNTGIRHARGRYIAFLDADDLWAPEKLERQVKHMEARPQVGVSYCCSMFIDRLGRPLGIYQANGLLPTTVARCLTRNPLGNGSTAMIRAEVFDPNHPNSAGRKVDNFYFDEELRQAEDFELWARIITQTRWRMECVPWALTHYRINTSGLSSDTNTQRGYHFFSLTKIHAYAPETIQKYRTKNLAYFYLYLSRVVLFQGESKRAALYCQVAFRYSPWIALRNGFLLIGAAVMHGRVPDPVYHFLESTGWAMTGKFQEAAMWCRRLFY